MNKKRLLAALLSAVSILSCFVSCVAPTPGPGEEPPKNDEKTYVNLTYELDGGTLPEGKWDVCPTESDFTLPIPEKEGYTQFEKVYRR